jgi:NitT/TauT family transport system substrate-binding protein
LWRGRDLGGPELKVLLAAEDYFSAAPVLNKVIAAEQDVLAARRPAVEKFVAAIIKASRVFAADPHVWVEAMQRVRPDVPRGELEELARSFALSWSANGGLDPAHVTYSLEQLYHEPDFRELRRVGADEVLDTAPIAAVLQRIGTASGLDAGVR